MELSRGKAYALGGVQLVANLAAVGLAPMPRVHAFVQQGLVRNGTVVFARLDAPLAQQCGLGIPTVLASVLAAVFSNFTYHVREHGLSDVDYTPEAVDGAGAWDLLFWGHCLLVHCIVCALIMSPVDVFGHVATTSFMVYFLYRVCAPRSGATNMTRENLNILGYGLGVLQCASQIPSQGQGNAATVLMSLVVLDYFLGVGHTWDRQATIETVTNCRLFYVCCASFGLAALYAAWVP